MKYLQNENDRQRASLCMPYLAEELLSLTGPSDCERNAFFLTYHLKYSRIKAAKILAISPDAVSRIAMDTMKKIVQYLSSLMPRASDREISLQQMSSLWLLDQLDDVEQKAIFLRYASPVNTAHLQEMQKRKNDDVQEIIRNAERKIVEILMNTMPEPECEEAV